ncbi:MAG: ABC transporter ATP-binding protein [Gammaproteobacteria bacterium]|nr:ABC transporter ATP-binding protein [Gammaproteobacteria bacterium]
MLEFLDISVSVKEKTLLDRVNLEIKPGELVGLIGPNGAGKSTLLKAGLGFIRSDHGSTHVDGQDYFSLSANDRGRKVAYLPQFSTLEWNMSCRSLVRLGRYPYRTFQGRQRQEDEDAVSRALLTVDARQFADQSVKSLSGGEKARVMLARALAVEAPWLLADEPIAGLDPHHQLLVMDVLKREAAKGCGLLVVIHDLVLAARFMDRLVLLHKGRQVAEGPPDRVLTQDVIRQVYGVETTRISIDHSSFHLPWKLAK